jgi:alpha-1,3-mannosyltransferase
LPENIFLSKQFAITLLTLHIGTLVFFTFIWLKAAKQQTQKRIFFGRRLAPDYVLYTLMLSNYVGIIFARTLHYQFYSWFFHAIPLLLWISPTYPVPLRIILWAAMEYAFNVYPATAVSSAILQVVNFSVLLNIRSPQELGIQILEEDRLSKILDQKDK